MIPFFKKFVYALLYDELAFIRWVRGFLGFVAGAAGSIAAVVIPNTGGDVSASLEVMAQWTASQWWGHLMVGFFLSLPFMVTAGQRNPAPPVLAQQVQPYLIYQGQVPQVAVKRPEEAYKAEVPLPDED
jgi:hypothetical protein